MKGSTPKARAINLRKTLDDLYGPRPDIHDATSIVDILTDLHHLCDAEGHNFGECNGMAHRHWVNEIEHPKTLKGA